MVQALIGSSSLRNGMSYRFCIPMPGRRNEFTSLTFFLEPNTIAWVLPALRRRPEFSAHSDTICAVKYLPKFYLSWCEDKFGGRLRKKYIWLYVCQVDLVDRLHIIQNSRWPRTELSGMPKLASSQSELPFSSVITIWDQPCTIWFTGEPIWRTPVDGAFAVASMVILYQRPC